MASPNINTITNTKPNTNTNTNSKPTTNTNTNTNTSLTWEGAGVTLVLQLVKRGRDLLRAFYDHHHHQTHCVYYLNFLVLCSSF